MNVSVKKHFSVAGCEAEGQRGNILVGNEINGDHVSRFR